MKKQRSDSMGIITNNLIEMLAELAKQKFNAKP